MNRHKFINTIFLLLTLITLLCYSTFLLKPDNLLAQTREVVVVYFEPDVDGIGPGNKEKVKSKVNDLDNIDEFKITLEGYSDITGRADYNLRLSRERAQLVKDYLVELGVDPNKIEAVGKGGTDRYASGETDDALARNRRVNLIIEIPAQAQVLEKAPEVQGAVQDELTDADQEQEDDVSAQETPQHSTVSLSDISEQIDKAIRQSASSGIVFSTPQEMNMGERYIVEAEVSYSFIEELSKGLDGFRLGDQIGLLLSGSDMDIFNDDLEIKTIEKELPSKWQWEVVPQEPGIKSLILSVSIASETVVLDDTYPTYSRIIDVLPSLIHSISNSYLIMALLIVLIVVIVALVLTRRVKFN